MLHCRWDSFLYKQKLYTDMKLERAFKLAMRTWARWIEKNVETSKTTVFFRGMSPTHSGRNKCYRATQPIKDESFKLKFSESLIKVLLRKQSKAWGHQWSTWTSRNWQGIEKMRILQFIGWERNSGRALIAVTGVSLVCLIHGTTYCMQPRSLIVLGAFLILETWMIFFKIFFFLF